MHPLVTIITPTTRDRGFFNKRIAQIAHSQTYPNIEHLWNYDNLPIGTKRNNIIQQAKGDIILHMDSDDWYQNDWVARSVNALIHGECDITGLQNGYFYRGDEKWLYTYCGNRSAFVLGATMCYWRSYALSHKFRNISTGEDSHFLFDNTPIIKPHTYIDGFGASIHGGNTCSNISNSPSWQRVKA